MLSINIIWLEIHCGVTLRSLEAHLTFLLLMQPKLKAKKVIQMKSACDIIILLRMFTHVMNKDVIRKNPSNLIRHVIGCEKPASSFLVTEEALFASLGVMNNSL